MYERNKKRKKEKCNAENDNVESAARMMIENADEIFRGLYLFFFLLFRAPTLACNAPAHKNVTEVARGERRPHPRLCGHDNVSASSIIFSSLLSRVLCGVIGGAASILGKLKARIHFAPFSPFSRAICRPRSRQNSSWRLDTIQI